MKKHNTKLIIFDCFGVVLSKGYPKTMSVLSKRTGISKDKLMNVFYKKYMNLAAERKISQREAWERPTKELGFKMKWQEVRDLHYALIKQNKTIWKLAKELQKNVKVVILSKNTRQQLRDINRMFQLKRYFEVINTWELGIRKASIETFKYIMKRYRVPTKRILYIDDQEANLIPARKLGIHTIQYRNYRQFNKEFKEELNNVNGRRFNKEEDSVRVAGKKRE